MTLESYAMFKALDIFCGGGGSSFGAHKAGVDIVAGIDMWPLATATFSANFPNAKILTKTLESIKPKSLYDQIGPIDILIASPECTNHTCAKGNGERSEDSRATAFQVIHFAKAFKPRWIVMENVVHMRPWTRYEEFKNKLKILGYHISEQVLDASHFGVPQKRRRLFIIGDLIQEPPQIVPPKKVKTKTVLDFLDQNGHWKATPLYQKGRAIATLERAERAIEKLGNNSKFLIVYYGTDGSGGWQRLDQPLRTITTVDRFAYVRPGENGYEMRMLQVPELKKAMGFIKEYKLPFGTRREQIHLLGNGVCPPVMKAIIKTIIKI